MTDPTPINRSRGFVAGREGVSTHVMSQTDKNEIGQYLVTMSKAVEHTWKLMDEDLLCHPVSAQLLGGIEECARAIRLMLVEMASIVDPGGLHSVPET